MGYRWYPDSRWQCWRRALKRYFKDRYGWDDLGKALVVHGMTDPGIVEGIFNHFGHEAKPGEIQQVLTDYVQMMRDHREGFDSSRTLPGVPDILKGSRGARGVSPGAVNRKC